MAATPAHSSPVSEYVPSPLIAGDEHSAGGDHAIMPTTRQLFPSLAPTPPTAAAHATAAAAAAAAANDVSSGIVLHTPHQSPTRAIHFGGSGSGSGSGPGSGSGSGSGSRPGSGSGSGGSMNGVAGRHRNSAAHHHSSSSLEDSKLLSAGSGGGGNGGTAASAVSVTGSPVLHIPYGALSFADSPQKPHSASTPVSASPRDSLNGGTVIGAGLIPPPGIDTAATPASSPPPPHAQSRLHHSQHAASTQHVSATTGAGAGGGVITPTASAVAALAAAMNAAVITVPNAGAGGRRNSTSSSVGSTGSGSPSHATQPPPHANVLRVLHAAPDHAQNVSRRRVNGAAAGGGGPAKSTASTRSSTAKRVSFDSPPPAAPQFGASSTTATPNGVSIRPVSLSAAMHAITVNHTPSNSHHQLLTASNLSTPIGTPQAIRHQPHNVHHAASTASSHAQPAQYHAAAFAPAPASNTNNLLATPTPAGNRSLLGVPVAAEASQLSTPTQQPILYQAHHMNSNARANKHRRNLSVTLVSAAAAGGPQKSKSKSRKPAATDDLVIKLSSPDHSHVATAENGLPIPILSALPPRPDDPLPLPLPVDIDAAGAGADGECDDPDMSDDEKALSTPNRAPHPAAAVDDSAPPPPPGFDEHPTIVMPHAFDEKSGKWKSLPVSDAKSGGAYGADEYSTVNRLESGLKLITHNIWFSPHRRAERMSALCALWESYEPDIMCLQEVVSSTLRFMLQQPWIRARYYSSHIKGSSVCPYAVVIFTKFRVHHFSVHPFRNTSMYRKLVVCHTHFNPIAGTSKPATVTTAAAAATVQPPASAYVFGSVHLESEEPHVNARIEQWTAAVTALQHHARALSHTTAGAIGSLNAVLCGDFNFGCEATAVGREFKNSATFQSKRAQSDSDGLGREERHIREFGRASTAVTPTAGTAAAAIHSDVDSGGFRDVWRELHPSSLGHSCGLGKDSGTGRRIDRVVMSDRCTDIKPHSIVLIGTEPMANSLDLSNQPLHTVTKDHRILTPSDHYGLLTTFEFTATATPATAATAATL